jgi:hypothetical protein
MLKYVQNYSGRRFTTEAESETLDTPKMDFSDQADDVARNQAHDDAQEILGTPKWNWKE